MEGRERRSEALPPTSKVKARGLGAILKHFPSLSLSYSSLSLFTPCSPPIPVSSASFFRSFSSSRLFSSNSTRFLPTRYVSLHAELTETKGTWHSATGMERSRANGSGTWTFREAQHCLSQAAPPFPEFCVYVVHLFTILAASFIFPERSARARHFMSHNYCPPLYSILPYFTPLSRFDAPYDKALYLSSEVPLSLAFPSTLSRDKIFILENGTNILKLSDYFPIVEAIRSFLIL